jgi:spore maturation protein CgeB
LAGRVSGLKITIFGLTISSSWGNGHATPYRAILRALKRMGHEVVFYERDVPYYRKRRDFTSVDFCRLVLYPDWGTVRQQAREDATQSDAVIYGSFCPDGANIIHEMLEFQRPAHVFYDLDTPVTLQKLEDDNCDYVTAEQIPAFDLYLSWCGGRILTTLQQPWKARQALPLYGCVDPDVHHRVEVPEPYRCRMSYMGTYAADRQQKFETLFLDPARQRAQDTFLLAGSQYPQGRWPANVRHFEHVSPHDHPALYSGSQFTLNITRATMARDGYCPSGRLFEAAACGTPIISDWFQGLDDFFAIGDEISVAQSASDVLDCFEMSDDQREQIATRARERTLSQHTGEDRARQLIHYLEDAVSGRTASVAEVA